jgi:hypothetical protein
MVGESSQGKGFRCKKLGERCSEIFATGPFYLSRLGNIIKSRGKKATCQVEIIFKAWRWFGIIQKRKLYIVVHIT